MTITMQYVPFEYAAQTWPLVEPLIERMAEFGPVDHTVDQMRMQVCLGNWQLLVFTDEAEVIVGVVTLSYQDYPNDRVAFVTAASGKGFYNKKGYEEVAQFVKSKGATRLQGYTRPSMARLARRCGMKEVATLMDAKI